MLIRSVSGDTLVNYYYSTQIKAPMMIQLGEVDLRCPISQGKELYYYLKAAGKKAE